MNVYRDLLEPGGGASGFCPQQTPLPLPPTIFRLPNGHSPGPAPGEPTVPSRLSVPKMGVRARIADWPPRRERSRESLLENGHPHRRPKDPEVGAGPGAGGAFRSGALRQRSSSEVTLSEQDEAEPEARPGLHREYGSTSSIDVQAVPEQSFFHMLSQFHQERPDQRSAGPARLGELLRADANQKPEASSRASLAHGY